MYTKLQEYTAKREKQSLIERQIGVVEGDLRNVVVFLDFDDELVDSVEESGAEGVVRPAFARNHWFDDFVRV